jgi:PAS domain S-box-containing protein
MGERLAMKVLHISGKTGFSRRIRELFDAIGETSPDEAGWILESAPPDLANPKEESARYDAVLLEHSEGKKAYETLKRLNEAGCRAPVLMIATEQNPSDELRARRLGVSDYLVVGQLNSELLKHSIRFAIENREKEESIKSSEALYKALTENSPVGIWNISDEGSTIYMNGVMCDLLEIENPDEIKNETYHSFFTPEGLERINSENRKRAEGVVSSYEVTLIGKRGSRREVVISGGPLFGQVGDYKGMIGIFTDITERKKAELQLWTAKERAEQATKLKDKFVSLVAHDMRAPLSSILSYLKMVKQSIESKPKQAETFADSSIKLSEDLLFLIENLLNLERVKTGVLEPKMGFFNFRHLAAKVYMDLDQPAGKKGVSLKLEIPQNARMYGDVELIREVIHNFVTNAIKFCRKDDIITTTFSNREKTVISVIDTGVGIAKERIDSLFNYDAKTSTAGTAGEVGTGLGLPLCRDIIMAQSGELTVESEPGKGSRFQISLESKKPKGIIVHSDQKFAEKTAEILGRIDIDAVIAKGSNEAARHLESVLPDYLFIEYGTAEKSGYELVENIQKTGQKRKIPIFVIMDKDDKMAEDGEIEAWATEFVSKQISEPELQRRFRTQLG